MRVQTCLCGQDVSWLRSWGCQTSDLVMSVRSGLHTCKPQGAFRPLFRIEPVDRLINRSTFKSFSRSHCHLSHNQNPTDESKGQSQPEMGAASLLILCMVLGRPFLYHVLILTDGMSSCAHQISGCYLDTIGRPMFIDVHFKPLSEWFL